MDAEENASTPASLSDIVVRVSNDTNEDSPSKDVTLDKVVEDFIERLNADPSYIFSMVVQLMVQGKIKVDTRLYVERMEMIEPKEVLLRADAVMLFDDYMRRRKNKDSAGKDPNITQRITIQPRKR